MDYVIRPPDRELFKRCRRAWDFGARTRRNLEPAAGADRAGAGRAGAEGARAGRASADRADAGRLVDRALHDALAVYYFPGMWDWDPAIVLPIVYQAFERSVREQCAGRDLDAGQLAAVQDARGLLEQYALWAPAVDRFAPIRVACDVDVQVPDPGDPATGIVTPGGGAVRYLDRLDLLLIDEHNAYWVLSHRVVPGDWPSTDDLLLDEEGVAWCWAWELSYPGMRVEGTIYNELRTGMRAGDGDDAGRTGGAPSARGTVTQHRQAYWPPTRARRVPPGSLRPTQRSAGAFRRTQIPRTRGELAEFGNRLALEAADMINPGLPLYPSPSQWNCGRCAYRAPCIAVNEGTGAEAVLASSYRLRPPPPSDEGRLGGGAWSTGRGAAPPRFGR